LIRHILKLNGFGKPYCQLKWIFSGFVAAAKSLIFLKWHFHAKMAPDIRPALLQSTVGGRARS
jgi:hypothetical protein